MFICSECKSLLEPTSDGYGVLCLNGHGRILHMQHDDWPKYEAVARDCRFGPWIRKQPEATQVEGGYKLYGLRGIYRKGRKIADGGPVPRGGAFSAGRIDDQVYEFTRTSGDGFACRGYTPLSRLRGSIKVWQGNCFSDLCAYVSDGKIALDGKFVCGVLGRLRDIRHPKRSLDAEQTVAAWGKLSEPLGESIDFVGCEDVVSDEFTGRLLHVETDKRHKFDGNRAAFIRSTVKPDEYRVRGDVLQFLRAGQVVGVLAGF